MSMYGCFTAPSTPCNDVLSKAVLHQSPFHHARCKELSQQISPKQTMSNRKFIQVEI